MSALPTEREKALEAIARGWGRQATSAHPLCRCDKHYLPTCRICLAKPDQPCRHQEGWDPLVLSDAGRAYLHLRTGFTATARQCPVHKPERRR